MANESPHFLHFFWERPDQKGGTSAPAGGGGDAEPDLYLVSLRGEERISGLFRFELQLASADLNTVDVDVIEPGEILGQTVGFSIRDEDDKDRYFNGIVSRFKYIGTIDSHHVYVAEVVPAMWFMRRRTNCRIFLNKSLDTIVSDVLGEYSNRGVGFNDDDVDGTYDARVQTVQYNESDFAFVSRLMEELGVYYYFKFDPDGESHQLVQCDQALSESAGGDTKAGDKLELQLSEVHDRFEVGDDLVAFEQEHQFITGTYSARDYNYTAAEALLDATESTSDDMGGLDDNLDAYEHYEYPGGYATQSQGDDVAEARAQAEHARFLAFRARGRNVWLSPARNFKLVAGTSCQSGERYNDQSFAVTWIRHIAIDRTHAVESPWLEESGEMGGDQGSGDQSESTVYINEFQCIPSAIQYRPPRVTRKPRVHGIQTAIVVGPTAGDGKSQRLKNIRGDSTTNEDDPVYPSPDHYARVKVQFHWDRDGGGDENTSAWVRVSQAWAGHHWGTMFIPHIGHEVIVEFVNGDPDRPIITGSLYNNEQPAPVDPADNENVYDHRDRGIIRDRYRNEIVFSAKSDHEFLTLRSSDKSSLRLDKNIKMMATGRKSEIIKGESSTIELSSKSIFNFGLKNTVSVASTTSFFVGIKTSFEIAASVSATLGTSFTAAYSNAFSYAKGNSVSLAAGKVHQLAQDEVIAHVAGDYVIDSDKDVLLIGGQSDESILRLKKDVAELAFGKYNDPAHADSPSRTALFTTMKAIGGIGTGIAGSAATIGSILAFASAVSKEAKADEDSEVTVGKGSDNRSHEDNLLSANSAFQAAAGLTSAATLAALYGVMRGLKRIKGKESHGDHDTEHARIGLDEKGVEISSGGKSDAASRLKILKDGVELDGNEKVINIGTGSNSEISLDTSSISIASGSIDIDGQTKINGNLVVQ